MNIRGWAAKIVLPLLVAMFCFAGTSELFSKSHAPTSLTFEAQAQDSLHPSTESGSSADEDSERGVAIFQATFAGISLASILILMASGLSIIFGLMGVINMAHGEFMMLGAFSCYVVNMAFKQFFPPQIFDFYWFVAIPVAFLVCAAIGAMCEALIIWRLYGRQLDSMLATWGIGLILIQAVRLTFGDTVALTPPSWFEGGWEITAGIVLPWNRIFIIAYSALCLGVLYWIIHHTRFGRILRATMQNREMASALGVNTKVIDRATFALGAGLAGLAGCAVVLVDKLNPQMGQGYIVDSFLVVVAGGVGKLFGIVVAGLGLGFLTKYLEPFLQAVYGKVFVLLAIVALIRWRPNGIFANRGRLAND